MDNAIPDTLEKWLLLRDSLRRQCADALESTLSLVNVPSSRAAVHEGDFDQPPPGAPPFKGDHTRPTATAHLVIALSDLGVHFRSSAPARTDSKSEITYSTATGVETSRTRHPLNTSLPYSTYLKHFLMAAAVKGDDYEGMLTRIAPSQAMQSDDPAVWADYITTVEGPSSVDAAWARVCLTQSEHYKGGTASDNERNGTPQADDRTGISQPGPLTKTPRPSEAICTSHLLHALHSLLSKIPRKQWESALVLLRGGCFWLAGRLVQIVRNAASRLASFTSTGDRCQVLEIPSYFIQTCAAGLKAASELLVTLKYQTGDPGPAKDPQSFLEPDLTEHRQLLSHWADRQVHRMMARRGMVGDPEFDVSTLVFSLRARDLCQGKPYPESFHSKCLAESYAGQMHNGCWPDGFSVDMPGWSGTSQPSVEIALAIASLAFQRDLLTNANDAQLTTARHALRSLLPFCSFLKNSRQSLPNTEQLEISGWCSDRKRSHQHVELWVTAIACRVLHLTLLLVESCARDEVLKKYGARMVQGSRNTGRTSGSMPSQKDSIITAFDRSVYEVDHITSPIKNIREQIFIAIIEARGSRLLYHPDRQ